MDHPIRVILSHVAGSKSGRTEVFQRDSVLIGRGDENDVAMDPFLDPTVSAQHAEIRIEEGHFVLYDMGSLNGTYLNGQPVRRAELEKGDEIALGRRGPRLRFNVEAEEAAARADSRRPARAAAASAPRTRRETPIPAEAAPKQGAPGFPTLYLVLIVTLLVLALILGSIFLA